MAHPHPHQHRCFAYNGKVVLSALDIRDLVTSGNLLPDDIITDTAGGQHYARSIAEFREPRWLRTLATDPICGMTDADCGISEEELLADMSIGDLEDMPPSFDEPKRCA